MHDTLTVDPGPIAINMDYGYMRAYDDLIGPAADQTASRASTDDIILTRLEAWTEQHFANGVRLGPRPADSPLVLRPSPTSLQTVRDLKMDVRTKTKARITRFGSDSVPKATAPWWQAFEPSVAAGDLGPLAGAQLAGRDAPRGADAAAMRTPMPATGDAVRRLADLLTYRLEEPAPRFDSLGSQTRH